MRGFIVVGFGCFLKGFDFFPHGLEQSINFIDFAGLFALFGCAHTRKKIDNINEATLGAFSEINVGDQGVQQGVLGFFPKVRARRRLAPVGIGNEVVREDLAVSFRGLRVEVGQGIEAF